MTTTAAGQKAELTATNYLEMRGYDILERNYRRPRCEIDIVARTNDVVYFVEVKYRKSDSQGGGLEAITQTKLRQMQFAAETWVDDYKWRGDYQLAAIEVGGKEFAVLSFIESIF